jgi:hypothetical protein
VHRYSSPHLGARYFTVDVTLRNCERFRINVQTVHVQQAENTRDIVSALSAKARFIWKIVQGGSSSGRELR